MAFRQKNGLTADGVCGMMTIESLFKCIPSKEIPMAACQAKCGRAAFFSVFALTIQRTESMII